MEPLGILLGKTVALALDRGDMQEDGAAQAFDVLQRQDQLAQVMPVDGADIAEPQFFEDQARDEEPLE